MNRKVVEFRLGSGDISTVRFGISPAFELIQAVRVIQLPQTAPLHWGWLRTLTDRDRESAQGLIGLICGTRGYSPDFLTGDPTGDSTPEEELERLRAVSDDQLRHDLSKRASLATRGERQQINNLIQHPRRTRAAIIEAWQQAWDTVLAPAWPHMLRLLRADISVRSRRSSDLGLGKMINTLHSTVTWDDHSVEVHMPSYAEVVDCGGTGLMLVPSILMPSSGCSVLTRGASQPSIFYPAHGVSEAWHTNTTDTQRALGALLGATRAHLLIELQQPLSTTECANAAGLAISTASHHLTVLRNAGLIDSQRRGAHIFHTRTPLGEALATRT